MESCCSSFSLKQPPSAFEYARPHFERIGTALCHPPSLTQRTCLQLSSLTSTCGVHKRSCPLYLTFSATLATPLSFSTLSHSTHECHTVHRSSNTFHCLSTQNTSMRLLDIALAGLLGLAGLVAAANNDKSYVPQLNKEGYTSWDNDATSKYM
ncbi:hypothetical protein DE146DRAFT_655612 [Phaeosphaeria sp. MPI-PUGE-AT-0046c]|nr:hypothetical protein DE146DRAFT_655612 [Phaeosphaeria sp. MPI-PUGE-AT-0046c]